MKSKMLLIFVISCGLSGWSQASNNTKPNLAKPYQKSFQAVWDTAGQGEMPIYECGSVVGTASKMVAEKQDKNNEAQQAYKACYVDAFLHYSDAYFALRDNSVIGEDNKPRGCMLFARYLKMSTSSLAVYADRFNLSLNDLNKQIVDGFGDAASLCENTFD